MKSARWQIRSALALIVLLAITIAWLWPRRDEPTFLRAYVSVGADSEVRRALLCSPLAEPEEPIPLIVAFHGVGDTPEEMLKYSQLGELAAAGRCYVLFPAARRGMWDTESRADDWANANRDAQFVRQLLKTLDRSIAIDEHRVFAVGMSNGATFAEMLSLALPCEIAATVGVAGALPDLSIESDKSRRVPMLLIAGALDETGAADAVQKMAVQLQQRGHKVRVQILDGVKHEWNLPQNDDLWEFLRDKRVPADCE